VDSNESPLQACAREIKEELGLDLRPVRLLCVDYIQETDNRTESLAFIFLGGDLSPEAIAAIRLPAEELSDCCFLEPQAALLRLGKRLRRRVQQALYAREQHTVFYLENQELVG
jgi:8-oxo-dGTP pyrophosphatase MutT (NUDIX family)